MLSATHHSRGLWMYFSLRICILCNLLHIFILWFLVFFVHAFSRILLFVKLWYFEILKEVNKFRFIWFKISKLFYMFYYFQVLFNNNISAIDKNITKIIGQQKHFNIKTTVSFIKYSQYVRCFQMLYYVDIIDLLPTSFKTKILR